MPRVGGNESDGESVSCVGPTVEILDEKFILPAEVLHDMVVE
jgi:hypothetical protein